MRSKILASLGVAVLLFGSASAASAKPLTKEEREAAVKYLRQTQKMLLEAVRGLSEEQLKWKRLLTSGPFSK